MRSFSTSALLVLILVYLTSCGLRERTVYFHKQESDSIVGQQGFTPTFKVDDFVLIVVTADDPETAVPFNFPVKFLPQSGGMVGYSTGNPISAGYLVDEEGKVQLPVIGGVHFAGKSRVQMLDELVKIYSNYLKNPVVNIFIKNFRVTVLGEVNNPGSFNIPNERITIIEALGIAGDLKMTGKRSNVLVIRDINGVKTQYRVDLTSPDLLKSEVFYLQQNDVVYVEPNFNSMSLSTFWRGAGPFIITVSNFLITTILILSK